MKQRVLIVTKFYYRRGGDCIYALNLERLLKENGHEVAVFAMRYPENIESPWSSYWPGQVDFAGGIRSKLSAVARTLGIGDVVSSFCRLLDDFRPDVVHLNNIHSYLSPVVASLAHRRGVRVVWTLHDYKLVCPAYSCLRRGSVCELCFTDKRKVLTGRCMKGSLAASAVAYAEALRWNRRALERNTDMFICPSSFMAGKMAQGRFSGSKLTVMSNFLAPEMIEAYRMVDPLAGDGGYYCYVGRLSEEKGVRTLLKAAATLPYTLKVAGDGPLAEELTALYAHNTNIIFLGRIPAGSVKELVAGARFSVMPSECYENNPLGVIESLCAGTPVVGACIGGIPELVTDSRGLTFESGNVDSLVAAIGKAWSMQFDRRRIQSEALSEFAPDAYYRRISEIYG